MRDARIGPLAPGSDQVCARPAPGPQSRRLAGLVRGSGTRIRCPRPSRPVHPVASPSLPPVTRSRTTPRRSDRSGPRQFPTGACSGQPRRQGDNRSIVQPPACARYRSRSWRRSAPSSHSSTASGRIRKPPHREGRGGPGSSGKASANWAIRCSSTALLSITSL